MGGDERNLGRGGKEGRKECGGRREGWNGEYERVEREEGSKPSKYSTPLQITALLPGVTRCLSYTA
jgi:hypothetical protein